MKLRYKTLKKILFLLLVLCFSIAITQNVKYYEPTNLKNFDNLRSSPSKGLDHDDFAEIHRYADQYVDWSFTTVPSQTINVWALDPLQYSIFTSGIPASGYLLSTSSSSSGRFYVPEGNTWYIIFWNDMLGSSYTIVSYSANFVGDSRPPSITVYEPYGSFRAGSTIPIDWGSINAGSFVRIELYKGASLHTTIITSTSNDGYHEWTSPPETTPGTDYRVKVSSTSTAAYDYSDYFEIRDPSVFIFYTPNSSCSYSMGAYYHLEYDNTEYVHEINLELFHNDTYTLTIVTDFNNYGAYRGDYGWGIPTFLIPSTNYSIKISDSEDPNSYGFSEYFEITEPRGFIFITPHSESQVNPNSEYEITWDHYGQCDFVKIELWRDMHYEYIDDDYTSILVGTELIQTISDNTANDGSILWNVPGLPDGHEYYIKISSLLDPGCVDQSDEFFIGIPEQSIPSFNLYLFISSLTIISIIYLYYHPSKTIKRIKSK